VAGKLDRFQRHALLQAAVAGQAHDVMIEDRVLGGVEARLGHLGRDAPCRPSCARLAERAGRRLDAVGRVHQLGVAGRLRAELAEALDLVEREAA
jgi:hypothetical protein